MDTLVLSFSYTPLDRIPWTRAISMVLSGRAEVVEEYEGRVIRSAREVFPMPSVIRFLGKVAGYFRRSVKFNRKNVWLRDKGTCQYCCCKVSIRTFTFDHVIPQAQGGTTCWENIVVACSKCNQKKQDRTPVQAKMHLHTAPVKPKSLPAGDLLAHWGDDIPETWKDYIGTIQYWHGTLT